jgi:hypothetical protein
MNKCIKCNKDKAIELFCENKKQFKTCIDCRNKCRNWRKKSKEVISLYNKTYKEKKLPNELEKIISNKNLVCIKNNSQLKKALNVPKSTRLQFPIESYILINNGNYPKKNITLI